MVDDLETQALSIIPPYLQIQAVKNILYVGETAKFLDDFCNILELKMGFESIHTFINKSLLLLTKGRILSNISLIYGVYWRMEDLI
jgi:hypothetical protein